MRGNEKKKIGEIGARRERKEKILHGTNASTSSVSHTFLSSQHHDRDGVWNSLCLSRGLTGILTDTRPDFLQSRKLSESLISIDTADTEIILEFDCSVP
jgi:hypothetical protein